MNHNMNNESRDDIEWLDLCERMGVDPVVEMERSLTERERPVPDGGQPSASF